ncbi:phytanoyl-CoA dioxygenase family protein [Acidisoma sp. C75]
MLGLFLRPDAGTLITGLAHAPAVTAHALEVIDQGYTVIPKAISPETCADTIKIFRAYEAANEPIFAPARDANGHYPRIVNLHQVIPELSRLFTRNPILLATLDALFGAPVSLYTSLFYEVGSQQPIHRDTPVFATRPEYLYFGLTVYLEPTDDDNGCLEVLPGGHLIPEVDREAMAIRRFGSLDAVPALDNDLWVEYQAAVTSEAERRGIIPKRLHVSAGDTLIWHPQLPHGGTPIHDHTRTRFSFVMHVTPEGVPVYHQNVFFAPSKPMPEEPRWGYHTVDGRKIADHHGYTSLGNGRGYHRDEFVRPVDLPALDA